MKGQDQKNDGNRHKNTVKFQSIHRSAHGRKELSCSALHQLHMRRIKGQEWFNPRLQMNEQEILINPNCYSPFQGERHWNPELNKLCCWSKLFSFLFFLFSSSPSFPPFPWRNGRKFHLRIHVFLALFLPVWQHKIITKGSKVCKEDRNKFLSIILFNKKNYKVILLLFFCFA